MGDKWEYIRRTGLYHDALVFEEKLNKLGALGWELVNVFDGYGMMVAIFKRRIEAGPVREGE